MKRKYLLGIDIGTTKTAVVLIDAEMRSPVSSLSMAHNGGTSCGSPGFAEQDMRKIEDSVARLIMAVPADAKENICSIGVTGQMHSVILWNDSERSNIITWQDKRASMSGNLQKYRKMSSRLLADGFGAVSMAELARTGRLSKWMHAATPADYLVMQLTGKREALTDPSFAASWGLLDPFEGEWDAVLAEKMGIPRTILPKIAKTGTVAGVTSGFPGLPDGIPVVTAVGDNQASIAGSCGSERENELFITVGTGAQVSAIVPAEEAASYRYSDIVEIRPFDSCHMLVVTAPLCGGKAWAWLGNFVSDVIGAFSAEKVPLEKILDTLDSMALEVDCDSGLKITPSFLGSRKQPEGRGTIENISLENMTLACMAKALAQGMAENLRSGFPDEIIRKRLKIIGSGNGLRHCISIQKAIEARFGLPVEIRSVSEEAATGAALLSGKSLANIFSAGTARKIKTIAGKTRIADCEKTYTSI